MVGSVFVTGQFMTSSEESGKDLLFRICHILITHFMRMEHFFVLRPLNSQENLPRPIGLDLHMLKYFVNENDYQIIRKCINERILDIYDT
jgi:hypothetical protein